MHDCPACKVPLHGYEEVCPSCGTRQAVRRQRSSSRLFEGEQREPGVNPTPFIITFVVVIIGLVIFANFTWLGQLMREGPPKENPLDKLTPMQAREIVMEKLNEGLSIHDAEGKFSWTAKGQEADQQTPGKVELYVETKLQDPNDRHEIIDPTKDYLPRALIMSLMMSDTKSGATWTYNVTFPEGGEPDLTGQEAAGGAAEGSGEESYDQGGYAEEGGYE